MKKSKLTKAATIAALIVLALSFSAHAQQRRLVKPAFPIGTGEKMLVIGSGIHTRTNPSSPTYYWTSTLNRPTIFPIHLPVGTTLKRVLGDFVDRVGADLVFELYRISNSDMSTNVVLRSFNTSGISSSSATDFKQIVSNPLTHSMLQGWSYYISVLFPGGTSDNDLSIGVLKIIYEP